MTALIVNLFELIGSLLTKSTNRVISVTDMQSGHSTNAFAHRSESSRRHSKHLVRPPLFHQTLSEEMIEQFDEVLVIGDVHGCLDELLEMLKLAEHSTGSSIANHTQDATNESSQQSPKRRILKLFVGDLINKGPKSKEVIDFMLQHPDDCLSVRGNHEEIAIKTYFSYHGKQTEEKDPDSFRDGSSPTESSESDSTTVGKKEKKKTKKHSKAEQAAAILDELQMDKYDWARELNQEQINYLISLPYTISVPSLNAIIVHAGLVAGLPLHLHDPFDLVHMRNYVFEDYFDGRGIRPLKTDDQGEPWARNWPGPEHVYFGHNAKRGLQMCEHATGLDTGCVVGNRLTGIFIKGPRKGQLLVVNSLQAYKVKGSKRKANTRQSSLCQ